MLGLALGLFDGLYEGWDYEGDACHSQRAPISRIMYLTPFVGNVLAYAWMLYAASRDSAPGSQTERALRRAGAFLLSFALSYSLTLAWLFGAPFGPALQCMANTTQACAGLFNALAYASQGRYATLSPWLPTRRRTSGDEELKASFRVKVGGAERIEYASEVSTTAGASRIENTSKALTA